MTQIINLLYTWHHLDDLDENLESTFQLVTIESHRATYGHIGSVGQIIKILGINIY